MAREDLTLLKVLCGSRAYGLEDTDSDFDYHTVFAVPTSALLSLGPKPRSTYWAEEGKSGGEDMTGWEVGHFLHLALHCNPTVLETFVAPLEYCLPGWGEALRSLMPHVLSREGVYQSFRGYASNQRKKMFDHEGGKLGGERTSKAAIAYLRSLYHGTVLLRKGTYDPYIADPQLREALREIRRSATSKAFVIEWAEKLEADLTRAYLASTLPVEPNIGAINEWLLDFRFWNR